MNLYEQAAAVLAILSLAGFIMIVRIYLRFKREAR